MSPTSPTLDPERSGTRVPLRSGARMALDFITFPLRAVSIFKGNRFGLTSLSNERFDYVRREVEGFCLDVGCGPGDRFVRDHLGGHGLGIDIYPYDGLSDDQVVPSLERFPFNDGRFATVTFIASLNHVPDRLRLQELGEAFRCLAPGGNIVVTMGAPIAEILVHRLASLYDRVLGTRINVDDERGMAEGERLYLKGVEIETLLKAAGFRDVRSRRFITQFGLNRLFVGRKPGGASSAA